MSSRKQRSCCLWLYRYSKRCFIIMLTAWKCAPAFWELSLSFPCLSSRPDFAAAWMNLGIVQNSLKRFQAAEQSYRTAIKHRRKYPDCYYNLGRLVSTWCPVAAAEKLGFVSFFIIK